jgi:hypothetical protein
MCLIYDRNSWEASLKMAVSLEVLYNVIYCSEKYLTSFHGGNKNDWF